MTWLDLAAALAPPLKRLRSRLNDQDDRLARLEEALSLQDDRLARLEEALSLQDGRLARLEEALGLRDGRPGEGRVAGELEKIWREIYRLDGGAYLRNVKTPFLDQPNPGEAARLYYIEITSACNLKCPLCPHGCAEMFQRTPGRMSLELFGRLLDKAKGESPSAVIALYHHCEPLLHPQLPEMLRAVKERGFRSELSLNLNRTEGLAEALAAGVDALIVSASGFGQELYGRSHTGGEAEKLKGNLRLLRRLMEETGARPAVFLSYHMYVDNLGADFDLMRDLARELGFVFLPAWARSINMELSLLHLRSLPAAAGRAVRYRSWLDELPPPPGGFAAALARAVYRPEDCLDSGLPRLRECPLAGNAIHIRNTGRANLCGCAFDDRMSLGPYLETAPEDLASARRHNPVCRECLANNLFYYWNYVDIDRLNRIALARLGPGVPADRLLA